MRSRYGDGRGPYSGERSGTEDIHFSDPTRPPPSHTRVTTNGSPVYPAFDQRYAPSFTRPQHVTPNFTGQSQPRSIRDIELQHVGPRSTPSSSVRARSVVTDVDSGSTANLVLNYEDPYDDSMSYVNFSSEAEKDNSGLGPKATQKTTKWTKRKFILCLLVSLPLLLAAILVPLGFFVLKPMFSSKTAAPVGDNNGGSDSDPKNGPTVAGPPGTINNGNNFSDSELMSQGTHDPPSLSIPPSAVGTVLDSTKWLDKTDFNLTYTNATVGGLSVMVSIYPEKN
jgi:hypothetical protein